MATKVRRITVNLASDVYEPLKDLSELSGKSMSFLVSDLMAGIIPQLSRTVDILKSVKDASEENRQRLLGQIEEYERKMLEAQSIFDR